LPEGAAPLPFPAAPEGAVPLQAESDTESATTAPAPVTRNVMRPPKQSSRHASSCQFCVDPARFRCARRVNRHMARRFCGEPHGTAGTRDAVVCAAAVAVRACVCDGDECPESGSCTTRPRCAQRFGSRSGLNQLDGRGAEWSWTRSGENVAVRRYLPSRLTSAPPSLCFCACSSPLCSRAKSIDPPDDST
jgi:hypothetical protein